MGHRSRAEDSPGAIRVVPSNCEILGSRYPRVSRGASRASDQLPHHLQRASPSGPTRMNLRYPGQKAIIRYRSDTEPLSFRYLMP